MRVRYTMAVANYEALQAIAVEIHTTDGHVGMGQATITAAAYSPYGETLEGAVHAINAVLGPQLVGLDPLAIEAAHQKMNKVLHGNVSAKAAVDIALHDLSGLILGIPVYSLLGGPLRTDLPVLSSIGYFPTEELVEKAVEAVAQGYKTIKIRVGDDVETDVRNLAALRERLGDDIALSVDFNQAMSEVHGRPDKAISYIRRLEAFNLDCIEQPVAGFDFEGMAHITSVVETPIVADESIWTLHDARRAIEMRACDIIKIKIVKTGGLLFARKMAAICESAGMPIIVGHGIAGSIQNAAEAHLAASLSNWKAPGEMNGYLKLADDIATPIPFEDGALKLGADAGLGLTHRSEQIKAFALAG
jgi:L-alanine-DL-glutamate epimerase-like enolase superfamily enzyme